MTKDYIEKTKEDLIFNATDHHLKEISKESEYTCLREKWSNIFDEIKSFLPKEKQRLLNRLEEVSNELGVIEIDYLYKKGLEDSKKLYDAIYK